MSEADATEETPSSAGKPQWRLQHLFIAMFIAACSFAALRTPFGVDVFIQLLFIALMLSPIIVLVVSGWVERAWLPERPRARILFKLGVGSLVMFVLLPIVLIIIALLIVGA